MDKIDVYFTKRIINPMSWVIRLANPVSFCKIAPASHCVVIDGMSGYAMQAAAENGVERLLLVDAMKGLQVVERKSFYVPDAKAGLDWMREVATRIPPAPYDWKGALALGLAPGRNWQEDTDWFCFEYLAMGLEKAGLPIFRNNAHVTAYMLLSLNTSPRQS